MNAQPILAKIEEEAREAAAAILRDAGARAEAMKLESEGNMAKQRQETTEKARLEAEALEERMLRMAQLEESKELLAEKRGLIDDAFKKALESLQSLPCDKLRDLFFDMVTKTAAGDETLIIGDQNSGWYAEGFLSEANQALAKSGKKASLTLSGEKAPGVTGLILSAKGMEVVCSLEALLSSMRLDMEADVAKILFAEA